MNKESLRLRSCLENDLVLLASQFGVRVLLDQASAWFSRNLELTLETDSFEMVRHFAACGQGIGIQVPVGLNAFACLDMAFVPISKTDVFGGELHLGHLRGSTLTVAALKFATQLVSVLY